MYSTINIRSSVLILFLLSAFFFTHFSIAAAQAEVTLLSPLPDTGASEPFNTYLPIIFNLAIGISGVLAVIVIIIGGLQYMSTDAISGKSDGRNKITAALTGLVFVLAAYLILQTINPNLVRFSLPVVGVNVTRTAVPVYAESSYTTATTDSRSTITGCKEPCEIINASGVRVSASACRPARPNCAVYVNEELAVELANTDSALRAGGLNLQVTEGYPPTVTHQNVCHQNGTCVDYNFIGQTGPASASRVNAVITAADSNGLRAVYEVANTSDCQALRSAGVPATNVFVVPGINNPHFSVYNPGQSNGNGQAC